MLTVRVGTVQAGKKKHTAYIGYRRGSFCLRVYNVLHWLLPANYQEGFCGPVFLRNKQHGSQVLGIRCHQPQSHRASSTGEVSEGNMESSSCLCLGVNFFGNHGDHNVFVAPADNHIQGAFLLNDVADVVGGDHRLSVDADDDVVFLEPPAATQKGNTIAMFPCLLVQPPGKVSNFTSTEAQFRTREPRADGGDGS